MIRPSATEIDRLKQVAQEVRDSTEESGFYVDVAVGQHEAFTQSEGPASLLERTLVLDAAQRGASQAGFGIERVSGSLDLLATGGTTLRRYRVKRITLNKEGVYGAICGAGSALLVSDPLSIFTEEKWIFGYITADDHTIDSLVAAEIVGWDGDGPVRLRFGTVIDLSEHKPPRGFVSTDEGLDGFEDHGKSSREVG